MLVFCRADGKLLPALSPRSVHPGLRKHSSFLSCGLGTVSALWKGQLSPVQTAVFPRRRRTVSQCVQRAEACMAVSQQARAGPNLGILRCHFSHKGTVICPVFHKPMFVGGGGGKWHLSHWQGMAASVLTLCASLGSLSQKGPQNPGT